MHSPLGLRLRELRAERGISLRDAARITGVDRDTIRGIELGERHPFDRTLGKLAKGYGISLRELLMESEESPGVAEKEPVPLVKAPQTGQQEEPTAPKTQAPPPPRPWSRDVVAEEIISQEEEEFTSHLVEQGFIQDPAQVHVVAPEDILWEDEEWREELAWVRRNFLQSSKGLERY